MGLDLLSTTAPLVGEVYEDRRVGEHDSRQGPPPMTAPTNDAVQAAREHLERACRDTLKDDEGEVLELDDHGDLLPVYAYADTVHVGTVLSVLSVLATLERERDEWERRAREALREVGKWAREAGEAKGRLEASELAGVVDGWRERAETAEAQRDEAVKALRPFAEVSAKATGKDDACWCGQDGAVIRHRDLRRAAALVASARDAEGGA